jgi:hypothetical protein
MQDSVSGGLTTWRELFRTISGKRRNRRFLVLLPFFLVIALMLAVIAGSGALAPFVYPLF